MVSGPEGEQGARTGAFTPPRTYINHMQMRVSLSEVLIDLGQAGPGVGEPALQGRFVTSPDFLLDMRSTIGGAIERYQAEFGGIVEASPGAGRG